VKHHWFVLSCLVACDGDDDESTFDVSSYDRQCMMASDCVLIYTGDPCGCDCTQDAIATSAREQYFADRDAYIQLHCPEGPPSCGPCPDSPDAVCQSSRCGLGS
jgi:hypothetical protein